MKVKVKCPAHIQDLIYSFHCNGGVAVIADIKPDMMFNARKSGKYYFVSRKHLGFQLRFTERAFYEIFNIVEG